MMDIALHEGWAPASFPGEMVEDEIEPSELRFTEAHLETRRVMSVEKEHLGVFVAESTPLPFWSHLLPHERSAFAQKLTTSKLKDLQHIHLVSKKLREHVRPRADGAFGWLAGLSLAGDEVLMVLAEVMCSDGVLVTKQAVVVPEPKDLRRARAFVSTLRPRTDALRHSECIAPRAVTL